MNYSRPSVMVNETLAEGVYAASGSAGSGECWAVSASSSQDWSGEGHIYRVKAVHSDTVEHISLSVTYTFTFAQPLTAFRCENAGWPTSFSGNTATVKRINHANAYKSGDNVDFMIVATCADEATTKSLPAPSVAWSCEHAVNVQNKYD